MPETGTIWVRTQTASASPNTIVIAQITSVEVYSPMSRQYHDSIITLARLEAFPNLLTRHIKTQYRVLILSENIVQQALTLQQSYRLRAYDAIQLASGLELHNRLVKTGQSVFFVSADKRLLQSAVSSGLAIHNPNHHS